MNFKSFFFVCLLAMTSMASAQEVIKMQDGSIVRCNNLVDVTSTKSWPIYRTLKTQFSSDEVLLTIEFVKCVQGFDRFGFVRDDDFSQRIVTFKDQKIKILRKDPAIVVTKKDSSVIAESPLKRHRDNTFTASLPLSLGKSERDEGRYFIEYNLRMRETVTDMLTGILLDSGDTFLGSYRVYFDK